MGIWARAQGHHHIQRVTMHGGICFQTGRDMAKDMNAWPHRDLQHNPTENYSTKPTRAPMNDYNMFTINGFIQKHLLNDSLLFTFLLNLSLNIFNSACI